MLCCLLAVVLAVAGVRGRRPVGRVGAGRAGCANGGRGRWAGGRGRWAGGRAEAGAGSEGYALGWRLAGFGACCGALAFEVGSVAAAGTGGLRSQRPGLLLAGACLVASVGALCALAGGAPKGRRAWAVFALSASGGSALAELADLHLLRLHTNPGAAASFALHGLAVVGGLVAAGLLAHGGWDAGRLPRRGEGVVPRTLPRRAR